MLKTISFVLSFTVFFYSYLMTMHQEDSFTYDIFKDGAEDKALYNQEIIKEFVEAIVVAENQWTELDDSTPMSLQDRKQKRINQENLVANLTRERNELLTSISFPSYDAQKGKEIVQKIERDDFFCHHIPQAAYRCVAYPLGLLCCCFCCCNDQIIDDVFPVPYDRAHFNALKALKLIERD